MCVQYSFPFSYIFLSLVHRRRQLHTLTTHGFQLSIQNTCNNTKYYYSCCCCCCCYCISCFCVLYNQRLFSVFFKYIYSSDVVLLAIVVILLNMYGEHDKNSCYKLSRICAHVFFYYYYYRYIGILFKCYVIYKCMQQLISKKGNTNVK